MRFPSIQNVARRLSHISSTLEISEPDDSTGSNGEGCEVRLQVCEDGAWGLHTGDPGYDTDHHGYWGSTTLDGRRFNSREVARDLIEQCRDMYAQATE